MTLEEALDFLASNCPTVFEPISKELARLNVNNQVLDKKVDLTQEAVNTILFDMMAAKQ